MEGRRVANKVLMGIKGRETDMYYVFYQVENRQYVVNESTRHGTDSVGVQAWLSLVIGYCIRYVGYE